MNHRNVSDKVKRSLQMMYSPTSSHELFLSVGRKKHVVELGSIGNKDLQWKETSEKTSVKIKKRRRKLKHFFMSILAKK